jgi:2-oxoglutarate ferredoxin oxidoreductase subunit alpha
MAMASATARCPAPIIPAAAYFTRGSGHNDKAQYTEREDDYIDNMDRLAHKFEVMRQHVPRAGGSDRRGRKIGFIAVGTSDYAVRESCDQLRRANTAIDASYLRLKAYPVHRRTWPTSSAATTASTWWIRIATRSCWA